MLIIATQIPVEIETTDAPYDIITFEMNVESNILSSSDLFEELVHNAFLETVTNGFYYIISIIYTSVDLLTLEFSLNMDAVYTNEDDSSITRRNLMQAATNVNKIFDYSITVEWSMTVNDESSYDIINDIIQNYNLNVSNYIEIDYFGLDNAIVEISNINDEFNIDNTDPSSESSNDNNNNSNSNATIFGINQTEFIIYIIIIGLIGMGCCFAFGSFAILRNKKYNV